MPQESDPIFSDARLAALSDVFDGERDDLDVYVAMVNELGATRVLDIGCGTGEFLVRLAETKGTEAAASGMNLTGLDPAAASLDIAKAKAGAGRVDWIEGDVTVLPSIEVDLVVMTGNVAQVFVGNEEWNAVLRAAATALRPGGHLVFETRDTAQQAWKGWTPESSFQQAKGPDGLMVETWNEVTSVELPMVTFEWTFRFADGSVVVSSSTLRFRARDEIEQALEAAGFDIVDVRDAPDRPGSEWVFVARRR